MLWNTSEYTPAAFTTHFVEIAPLLVTNSKPPSFLTISLTSVLNLNSTPFVAAFSAIAMFNSNGQTIPPVGAYNAATTSSVTFGSNANTSSCSKIFNSFTPFLTPLS